MSSDEDDSHEKVELELALTINTTDDSQLYRPQDQQEGHRILL